ncbi:hypothetical protein EZS27_005571 [termite gut metagenome]|uniref:Baseplate protein J-like domain-containing protein n=1 Tax=termite gut metagenome TaxID=433724 RepID=A0A5J4SKS1_9ZZZZ
MEDGLSQSGRKKRIRDAGTFTVVDDRLETLLQRVEKVARFIRYYDLGDDSSDKLPKGQFDQFLEEIKKIRAGATEASFEGNMEPAQALLYTFLKHLSEISGQFNERWKDYARWYLDEVLRVEPLSISPDYTWISFVKNVPHNILIKKGTRFTNKETDAENRIYYSLEKDIEVNNVSVEKILTVNFEKHSDIPSSDYFDFPTKLSIKNWLGTTGAASFPVNIHHFLGFCVFSPSLLLREGKRWVCLSFQSENSIIGNRQTRKKLCELICFIREKDTKHLSFRQGKEIVLFMLLANIFSLEISTSEGWTNIPKHTVKYNASGKELLLQFELDETFPKTTACDEEAHGQLSRVPGLRIYLNQDSWLFSYSWLKDFLIKKISIKTRVEGITNMKFYNELGEVDISKPFAPLGINPEQDAWFVLGNYEMAVKSVRSMSVDILWQHLPKNEGGLYTYYRDYKNGTDNLSFKLIPKQLSDYKWKETGNKKPFYLFSTPVKDKQGNPEPQYRLSEKTVLKDIIFESVKPINISEEEYNYSIHAKNGFVKLILTEPEMGFGERIYRQIFMDVIKQAMRKKAGRTLNTPINPLVERINLSYESYDEIDFTFHASENNTQLYHIYPLGQKLIYPSSEYKSQPFVFSLDTDDNILFGLKNVTGKEYINFYLDLIPREIEIDYPDLPKTHWFWGDGYRWEPLPIGSVLENNTRNLITSGLIKIYLPEIPEEGFRDADGLVWIRVGISQCGYNISPINRIFVNTVKAYKDVERSDCKRETGYVLNQAESEISGITDIVQMAPFSEEYQKEDAQSKQIRVSEYITHRGRAVTARDYERITLQAFSEVDKVKCLPDWNKKTEANINTEPLGMVTLVIVPSRTYTQNFSRPLASAELLLKIEDFFARRISGCIGKIDAVDPLYEEITVRCAVELAQTYRTEEEYHATITELINHVIAPWQKKEESPNFGHSFTLEELCKGLEKMKQVQEIISLSVIHLIFRDGLYSIKEYKQPNERVAPSCFRAILVPADGGHLILSKEEPGFGINEMRINETQIIWQNDVEKR